MSPSDYEPKPPPHRTVLGIVAVAVVALVAVAILLFGRNASGPAQGVAPPQAVPTQGPGGEVPPVQGPPLLR